jgi:hypothetical protein
LSAIFLAAIHAPAAQPSMKTPAELLTDYTDHTDFFPPIRVIRELFSGQEAADCAMTKSTSFESTQF